LKVFGSKPFSHIPKENRRKLDAKSVKCIFIGYCVDHKAYKMYDPITHKVFASRDVIFHEYADDDSQDVWKLFEEGIESAKVEESEDQQDDVESQSGIEATSSKSTPRKSGATPPRNEALRRSTRQIKTPTRYKDYALMSQVMSVEEPLNFEKAKDHKKWMNVMQEEYDYIVKNGTCELTEFLKIKFL
jgi:hypothetical protein